MRQLRRLKLLLSAVASALFCSTPALSWDGIVTGKIVGVDVTAGGNYDFRVYLDGVVNFCGAGTAGFAYVQQADANYEAYVAMLTTAYASGKTVTVYSTLVSGLNYCHIGYIHVVG